jgi:hypothetical protein
LLLKCGKAINALPHVTLLLPSVCTLFGGYSSASKVRLNRLFAYKMKENKMRVASKRTGGTRPACNAYVPISGSLYAQQPSYDPIVVEGSLPDPSTMAKGLTSKA